MTSTSTDQTQGGGNTALVDFSQALSETESSTTAGCIEALLPGITESFWLLANSNALIQASDARVLNMILERALPNGVSMALEVSWTPER